MARLIGHIRTYENWFVHYRARWGWGIRKGDRLELRLRNGLRQIVRAGTNDLLTSRSVFTDRSYLTPGLEIAPDAVVIDVGAQVGSFTLFAAQLAPKGRVLAFEPEPSNFALLSENVRRNRLAGATPIGLAVAGSPGERTLHLAEDTGAHSLGPTGTGRSIRVACTSLPAIAEEHGLDRIDFLKMDCEGAEVEILAGTPDALLRRIRQLALEDHAPAATAPQLDRLRASGFEELPGKKRNYRYFRRKCLR